VAVEVDETWGDDEPADVDCRAVETVADRRDRVTVDPHVAHTVEPGLRIDDPTTSQHRVVRHEPTPSGRAPRHRPSTYVASGRAGTVAGAQFAEDDVDHPGQDWARLGARDPELLAHPEPRL